jgi:hypothetical protein
MGEVQRDVVAVLRAGAPATVAATALYVSGVAEKRWQDAPCRPIFQALFARDRGAQTAAAAEVMGNA